MSILFATPYLPYPPDFGGARRMFELIRGAGRHHDVRTVSLSDAEEISEPAEAALGRVTPVPVRFTPLSLDTRTRRILQIRSFASTASAQHLFYIHAEFQRALNRLVASDGIDLVQLEFSQMGGYRVRSTVPTILDVHNVEHDLLRGMSSSGPGARRLFNAIEFRKVRSEEVVAWRRANCCIATSERDAAVVSRFTGHQTEVIPNGVDLEYFKVAPAERIEPGSITFIGAMRYRPNAEGARFFVEQIFPLICKSTPDATFTVVGADPTPGVTALGSSPGVTVTGTVPDVRPWLELAEVVAVPLTMGGGTRLKILEAFAAGRAVVSTTVGAEGLEVIDRKHLLLADEPSQFAAAVTELMRDESLRHRLTENALELVRERYQWSVIADRLSELHTRLIAESGGGVSERSV